MPASSSMIFMPIPDWRARGPRLVRARRPGHPGIEGASWGAASLRAARRPAQPGNRLLAAARPHRRHATGHDAMRSSATSASISRAPTAARVRLQRMRSAGAGTATWSCRPSTPRAAEVDFDPEYSELDWEYLPKGGWGDARTRLYGVSWRRCASSPGSVQSAARRVPLDGRAGTCC